MASLCLCVVALSGGFGFCALSSLPPLPTPPHLQAVLARAPFAVQGDQQKQCQEVKRESAAKQPGQHLLVKQLFNESVLGSGGRRPIPLRSSKTVHPLLCCAPEKKAVGRML